MKVKEAAGRNFYSVVKIRRDGEELRKKKKNAKVTLSDSFLIDSSLQCHSRDYVLDLEAVGHADCSLTHTQRNSLCFVIDKSVPILYYALPGASNLVKVRIGLG